MASPKISIIMPSYNYAHLITRAVDSILAQSCSDWELVIVDDGSTDNTLEVLQQYTDHRISVCQHHDKRNHGLSQTLRYAISKVKGEYTAFLECDDYWEPDYLEQKLKAFAFSKNVNLVFNDIRVFGEDSALVADTQAYVESCKNTYNTAVKEGNFLQCFLKSNTIPTFSCVMVKTRALKRCNFNAPVDAWLDWWLWSQLSAYNSIFMIDNKLTCWMSHVKSYNSEYKQKQAEHVKLITNNFRKSILKCLLFNHTASFLKNLPLLLNLKVHKKQMEDAQRKNMKQRARELLFKALRLAGEGPSSSVYFYGAGKFAALMIELPEFDKLKPVGFFDMNQSKIAEEFLGYPLYSPERITDINPDTIVVSVEQHSRVAQYLSDYRVEHNLRFRIITCDGVSEAPVHDWQNKGSLLH